ncbi:hypothetical protein ACFO1B_08050 [Dactylosporangium siamense]|uniref:Uncharacterized protein n=1 Tax=Dactylosporangium siamense TaxID=685454 RepID=A0A919PNX7_9ACTN|nr:hypothetical protein [Dactylosporangium siamense]GIG48061.1 hypothetical protein Dsi01nite_061020 [Dactylosporangium siamense]
MVQQNSTNRLSRRGILTGAGAGGVAAVAAAVTTTGPAAAATGDPVVQGADNNAGADTTVLRSTSGDATLDVRNTATVAVDADGFDAGVIGFSSNGNGLIGRTDIGYGVIGIAGGPGGVAVVASAPDEYGKTALSVRGQAQFSRSGTTTVPAGANSVTVSGLHLYASTRAFALAQRNTAAFVKAAVPDPATGQLRLHLNIAAPAGGVPVAWWLLA